MRDSTEDYDAEEIKSNRELCDYLQKFTTLLENKNSKFEPSIVLQRIKGTWLFEQEILLLIKENKNKEALESFVKRNKFKEAEEFCIKQDKELRLLSTLFEIYINYYEELSHKKTPGGGG